MQIKCLFTIINANRYLILKKKIVLSSLKTRKRTHFKCLGTLKCLALEFGTYWKFEFLPIFSTLDDIYSQRFCGVCLFSYCKSPPPRQVGCNEPFVFSDGQSRCAQTHQDLRGGFVSQSFLMIHFEVWNYKLQYLHTTMEKNATLNHTFKTRNCSNLNKDIVLENFLFKWYDFLNENTQ